MNLGIIKRTFSYLDKLCFLNLYKSIVRPHLEYASTVLSVYIRRTASLLKMSKEGRLEWYTA